MGRQLKVLLIDDSPDDADLAILQLRGGGWDIYPLRVDTRDALRAALNEHLWDVILSDFSMPGFSGEEALRLVREAGLDTPFIIISGIIGEETAVTMMRAGAQDYVMKDRLGRLVPAVERELQEAEVRREKQRQEISLRKNEENLRKAQRIANFGSWEWNILTNEVTWSEEVYRLYGLDPMRDLPSYDVVVRTLVPESRDQFVAAVEDAVKLGKHFEGEYRMISLDGTARYTHTVGEVLHDAQGRPVSMFGVVQDITERKQVEERLRESQHFLQTVMDGVDEPIMVIGMDYRVLMMNNAARRNSGSGTLCHEVSHHSKDPCGGKKDACPLEAVRTTSKPVSVIHEHVDDKGRVRLIEILASPYYGPDGTMLGIIESSRDITERKRAEDEKLRLERQVQHAQKLESLGVLAGGIAHDFNNILMGILGNTALALMRLPENSSGRESLLEIEKAARRAADLSMQMLAYSGKGKFLIGPIDLNRLVNEMARLLEVSISKKAELRYDFRNDLPQFEGDATQVRQIVMNLITNASEAIGKAGGSITLSTGVTVCDRSYIDSTNEVLLASYDAPLPEGRYVFLDVSDTGCGMDEDTRRKIFDPFFTTKFTGRGLGMAAVLGILRGHHGTIRIYSEVGKGTTIRVLFPAGEEIAVPQAGEEKAAEGEWRRTGKVLLVDDDKTVCAVGSELLKHIGFTVLTAPDGKKALEVFRAHAESIVAVLLDLTMPHMGGEEVFSELRRLRPDVKVVLCSGFTEQDATTRMSGKGLAGFLQKPYDIARLSRVLKQVLGEETVLPSR